MVTGNRHYAIIAGLCASSASFFGKLPSIVNSDNFFFKENCVLNQEQLKWLIQVVSVILMIVSNCLVWRFFVKSLQDNKGTLAVTVISAGANYSCSALLGTLVYGEKTSVFWWGGTLLVLTGLMMILTDSNNNGSENDKFKKIK